MKNPADGVLCFGRKRRPVLESNIYKKSLLELCANFG